MNRIFSCSKKAGSSAQRAAPLGVTHIDFKGLQHKHLDAAEGWSCAFLILDEENSWGKRESYLFSKAV